VAQVQRLQAQRDHVAAEAESVDAEATVLQELTDLRALVVGDARDGSREGLQAFRAALRRLFVAFDLLGTPGRPFGATPPEGEDALPFPHESLHMPASGLSLLPRVRRDVIRDWWDEEAAFPALRRAALALRDSDHNGLGT
jgi:hypothetical protein